MKNLAKITFLAILSAILLAGCGINSKKQAFIDANVEAGCFLVNEGQAYSDDENDAKFKEIFASHGFDDESEEALAKLTELSKDPEVVNGFIEGISDCIGEDLEGLSPEDLEEFFGGLPAENNGDEGAGEIQFEEDASVEGEL